MAGAEQPLDRRARGDAVEDSALAYLQGQGLRLVARNARARGGELDLVMFEREALVFVEVRYRAASRFGGGAASVDAAVYRYPTMALAAQVLAVVGLGVARSALDEVGEELADVLCYALAMANELGLDITTIVRRKMAKNAAKYPADKYRGLFGPDDPNSPKQPGG